MEIRKAEMADKAAVLEFCKKTFSWGDYISEVWDKWESIGGLYVVEVAGKVVGVYHMALLGTGVWLEGMRVMPQYRKKGLGSMMMSHAELVAKHGTVRLIVESENKASIGLAKSVGYHLEEKWRLYSMAPEKQESLAMVAKDLTCLGNLTTTTYADSWRWLTLDDREVQRLVLQGRVICFSKGDLVLAVGIWNRSSDFPDAFQLGFVGGDPRGVDEVLRFAKNLAYRMNCERVQVFAPESPMLGSSLLEKKSLFYLMKKDLGKNL